MTKGISPPTGSFIQKTFFSHCLSRIPVALLGMMFWLLQPTVPVQAATLCVNPAAIGCYNTIQAAINAANPAGGDTLNVSARVYNELLTIDRNLVIQGSRTSEFPIITTTISGTGLTGPVVDICCGKTVTLDTLKIINGNNTLSDGGGIRKNLNAGTLTMRHVTVSNNRTANYGGGIYARGIMRLNDCWVGDNTAEESGGGISGAQSQVSMTRTNVMRNVGRSGGGLAISGSLEITDGIISGNTCQYDGGGISLGWGNASFLNRVTINDNQAGVNGGGIANQGSVVTLTNVTISGNSATTGDGGAIYNYAQTGHLSSVKLSSSTVAYNSAPFGARGGLMGWQDVNGQNTIIIFSSIFAYNSGDNCFIDEGTIESWGYNVFDDENCSPVPSADLVNTDPKLSPLAWNSGYVQTHALQPGSPAVGHNKLACEEVDARGVPRRTPCDSGSFEQTKWVFIPLILNQ